MIRFNDVESAICWMLSLSSAIALLVLALSHAHWTALIP